MKKRIVSLLLCGVMVFHWPDAAVQVQAAQAAERTM